LTHSTLQALKALLTAWWPWCPTSAKSGPLAQTQLKSGTTLAQQTSPLQRIQGAFNELGCAAPYSVAKMDNGLFWLGRDRRGEGIVYRANGYSGVRISTHAVEWQIQQYADMSDAIAYTYQQDGHSFYVLVFPSANTTWVYDAATQAWHERAGFS
jgi:hypothetical protein